jgi:molybdopterin converting factor small subunit
MIVKVRLFATLRKYLPELDPGHSKQIKLQVNSTISDLYEDLGIQKNVMKIAFVNGILCEIDTLLQEGDEIGIFPPIEGGSF